MIRPLPILASACVAIGLMAGGAARGQDPAPIIPRMDERSGLITRFTPIVPNLPPDPHRDLYYNTRWANYPGIGYPNAIKTGGLYGMKFKDTHTGAYPPYFAGSAGLTKPNPSSNRMPFRALSNFVHPFQPVCGYYSHGVWVPVYDLDPWVPGPGPFPWPHFFYKLPGG